MVKPGDELREGEATDLTQKSQPLSTPERNLSSIARSKTKRSGTPPPEKTLRALKRAGHESGSEVSRTKKKMVFEMADNLIAELHGEGMGSPDGELVPFEEMLSSLAKMAKDERAPMSELEGIDGVGLVGLAPAPDGRSLEAPRLDWEMVNKGDLASTTSHVKARCGDRLACDGLDACESQREKETNATLHGKENDGPIVVNAILNSKSTPCAILLPCGNDGGKGDRAPDARSSEAPPEHLVSPANTWKEAKDFFSHGGTGFVVGTSNSHITRKAEPIALDAGKAKLMGTAGCYEGIPSLSFSDLETKYLSEKLGLAIVGKFSHSLPTTLQIQKSLGGMGLVGPYSWKYLNAKHILLQFQEVADYAKVLNGPNESPIWYIDVHPMRVFKWAPDFDSFFESSIVAVWCNIVVVPAHLFEESALLAIGKLLGKPLQADHATINQTRLSFARICVEIDISKPPTEEIILNILGKESRHKVAWDRIPLFCENCKHIGHVIAECHALGRKGRVRGKDYRASSKVYHSSHVPKTIRREWRPKAASMVGTSMNIAHTNKDEDSDTQEKNKVGTVDADPLSPRMPFGSQPIVDEDGFQLVTRKRKGKARKGETHSKAQHIDYWRSKDNVATVSFDRDESSTNEPSTRSMSVSCGLPDQEKEGFIEDLDPGGIIHRGGIPIAGLN